MRIALATLFSVVLLASPANAGHSENLDPCRAHEPPDKGSCVFDSRHAKGPYADWYTVSYRLWADGTQKFITHHRAHHLLNRAS